MNGAYFDLSRIDSWTGTTWAKAEERGRRGQRKKMEPAEKRRTGEKVPPSTKATPDRMKNPLANRNRIGRLRVSFAAPAVSLRFGRDEMAR
jgi:hypothetical protein